MTAPLAASLAATPAAPRTIDDARTDGGPRYGVEMVLPTLAAAGMETVVVDLVLALVERGHRVGVTCLEAEGPLADLLRGRGVRVSHVAAPGLRTNLRAPALAGHFARVAPDVVHVHSGAWAKAAVAARAAGVPAVVHTAHGLLDREPRYGPLLKRWAARATDGIAVVSEPLRRYFVDDVGLPARRVEVLPNGIDVARFAPDGPTHGLRARLGVPEAAPLVGTVARLVPVKNQALLLDAFARIVSGAAPSAAHLVLVGDGALRDALGAQAAALGIAERVHFPGAIADVAPVYRELDAFVLCSLAEGTSISLLEAMASGVPVVATAVGGSPDVVADGAAGVLVPSGDAAALAEALAGVLGDGARHARLAAAGRARAVAAYSRAAMADAYEALYARALSRRAGRSGSLQRD